MCDALVAADHTAEGPALGGIAAHLLVRGRTHADQRGCGEHQPLVQRRLEGVFAPPHRWRARCHPRASMSARGADPRLATACRLSSGVGTRSKRSPSRTTSASQTAPAGTRGAMPAWAGWRDRETSRVPCEHRGQRLESDSRTHIGQESRRHLTFDHRSRREPTTRLLCHQREVEHGRAPPTLLLGNGHGEHARLDQVVPERRRRTPPALPHGPGRGRTPGRTIRRRT